MRITEVHVYAKDLPIVGGPYTMSHSLLHAIDTTVVKMVSDTGLVGWGEVAPIGPVYQPQHGLGARAAIAEMAPGLIGESALAPLLFRRRMDGLLNSHSYAKSALDIAYLDMLGKHHGVRVAELLGGVAQERLPGYYAIGLVSPDEAAAIAAEKVAMGYPRIQLKAGGRDVSIDIEAVRKTWERIGTSAQLIVDANRGMTASEALRLCLACADIPFTLEQPCNTMEEVASLRNKIPHPLALDENTEGLADVIRAIVMGACDSFGFKISRFGGPTGMTAVRDLCAARSMPHNVEDMWGGDIVSAAILHVAATVEPRLMEGVWTSGNYIEEHFDPENGIAVDAGHFTLPSGPGLGITPLEDRIGTLTASYA